jgi:signal peptide peptidase SppA
MSILMPRVASRMLGVPLMVDAGKLAAILAGLGGRIAEGGIMLPNISPVDHVAFAGGRPSQSMGVVGEPMAAAVAKIEAQGRPVLQRVGSVAVIPIEGTLVQKGKWIGQDSGETSYEGIRALVARAGADDTVKGVVLEVDSYGGEVPGAFETAQAIAGLSALKPTLAILTDFAYSAGYLMASAARQIVMPEGGGAGSIGVVAIHQDYSKQLEQKGIAVSLITAGAHKADGNPFQPLADSVRAEWQASVDASYERFVAAVGDRRGSRLDRNAARATEARTYDGHDAVKAGLVDGIIDPQVAFAEFVKRVS